MIPINSYVRRYPLLLLLLLLLDPLRGEVLIFLYCIRIIIGVRVCAWINIRVEGKGEDEM